jgi:hypothetical protein
LAELQSLEQLALSLRAFQSAALSLWARQPSAFQELAQRLGW